MIGTENISANSSLVDDDLKIQLAGIFEKMDETVTMKAVVDPEKEKDRELASFLKALVSVSDKVKLELYEPAEAEKIPELDVSHLPVTGIFKEQTYRNISFHGIPGGKEINALVLAIYNIGGPGQEIPQETREEIAKIHNKVNVKVCVALDCQFCAKMVNSCQKISALNNNVRVEMLDVELYRDMIEKYQIQRVPVMIVNDTEVYTGSRNINEIIELLKK